MPQHDLLTFQAKPTGKHLWHQASASLSSWWAFSQYVISGKSELVTPADLVNLPCAVYMYVCSYGEAYAHVRACGGQRRMSERMSSSVTLCLLPLKQVLSLNLKVARLTRLAGQQAPRNLLFPPPALGSQAHTAGHTLLLYGC